jgi:uncharacterized membrane protein YcaP (DUF421 family)
VREPESRNGSRRSPTDHLAGARQSRPVTDLLDILVPELPIWQMVLRGSAVYWFLLLVFRFVLRRDLGSLGVADLLFVFLVADASSNAMQGEYRTLGDGLVLLTTLIGWNYVLDWLSYRYEAVNRFLEPATVVVIRHGRPMRRVLKREMITLDELRGQLREQGVEDIATVRVARLEADGKLSVFTYQEKPKPEAH